MLSDKRGSADGGAELEMNPRSHPQSGAQLLRTAYLPLQRTSGSRNSTSLCGLILEMNRGRYCARVCLGAPPSPEGHLSLRKQ